MEEEDHDSDDDDDSPKRKARIAMVQKLKKHKEVLADKINKYYGRTYFSLPSSYITYRLAVDLNKLDNEYLWYAIVGATSMYLEQKLSKVSAAHELMADWDRFYRSYSRIIQRFAMACGMQDCDVDECSQEVWLAVVNGLKTFEHDPARARFRSWLYRIVSNNAADQVRDRVKHSALSLNDSSRSFELHDPGPAPMQNLDAAWRSELLREAISVLKEKTTPRDFTIFSERTIRKTPATRVAEKFDMNDGAVRVVDHRLRKQLQDILNLLTDGQMVATFLEE